MPSTRDTPTSSWSPGWMERIHRAPGARNCRTAELPRWVLAKVATQIQRWVLGEKINPDRDQLQVTFKKNYSKIFKGYFGRQDFKMKHLLMCNYFDHDPILSDSKHWSSGAFKKFIETSAKPKLSSRIGPWLPQIDTYWSNIDYMIN